MNPGVAAAAEKFLSLFAVVGLDFADEQCVRSRRHILRHGHRNREPPGEILLSKHAVSRGFVNTNAGLS